jgi:hypothetical protein
VLPAAYDPVASYEGQVLCDATPKPGTKALANLIRKTYGSGQGIGMTRGCRIGGTSEHKDGRAVDWMTSARSRKGLANAKAFLSWLLGPDQLGVPYGNATRLGVMYIGWNNRFWGAYSADQGWTELRGCFSRPGRGNDTDCHRNHIHISLSWDGASGRTSMWDGTVLAPFCPTARSSAAVAVGGRAADVVAVPPVRVLNTRLGLGLVQGWSGYPHDDGIPHDGDYREDAPPPATEPVPPVEPMPPVEPTPLPPVTAAPCRVQPGGWHDDLGGVLTKVTGQGGVPEVGVVAVAVTVTALGSTAPASISVWAPGMAAGSVVATVKMNGRGSGSAIVPVASDGTIAQGTSAGGTDLTVDVTGYYLMGDQPNVTVTSHS